MCSWDADCVNWIHDGRYRARDVVDVTPRAKEPRQGKYGCVSTALKQGSSTYHHGVVDRRPFLVLTHGSFCG